MEHSESWSDKFATLGIAFFCLGYFTFYIPFSIITKMLTKGLFSGMDGVGFSGFEIQPMVAVGSFVSMYTFFTISKWWKYSTHRKIWGVSLPCPRWFTFISGICTAGIIVTTTLAYTFSGISIVFAMLLMRGGVLALAPVVDTIVKRRKRKIYWPSWVAAGLSFGALLAAFIDKASMAITVIAAVDISIYLFSYFFRFIFMGSYAKSGDQLEKKRYFVEEQMIANPLLLAVLLIIGIVGSTMAPETIPGKIWTGFVAFPFKGYLPHAFLIGFFSYCVGLFGNLIYLDKREHTFCVPANRCSSILAGTIATYILAIFFDQRYPSYAQLIGVIMILGAIVFLSWRSLIEKKCAPCGGKTTKTKPKSKPTTGNTLKTATETE